MLKRIFNAVYGRKDDAPPPETDDSTGAEEMIATDANFDSLVLGSAGMTVVDFWAEWCQPCQVMSAYVEFLARDFAGKIRVAALDVDENPATAERFGVMGLPTLIFFCDGLEVERAMGVSGYNELKRKTARLLDTWAGETS